jgi:hypothetical protein
MKSNFFNFTLAGCFLGFCWSFFVVYAKQIKVMSALFMCITRETVSYDQKAKNYCIIDKIKRLDFYEIQISAGVWTFEPIK